MPRDKEDESKQALLGNEQQNKKGLDLRVKPKRNVIVEPLLFLFFLSGMPVTDLKSQYMYNRIAEDMGVNLTSKKHSPPPPKKLVMINNLTITVKRTGLNAIFPL